MPRVSECPVGFTPAQPARPRLWLGACHGNIIEGCNGVPGRWESSEDRPVETTNPATGDSATQVPG